MTVLLTSIVEGTAKNSNKFVTLKFMDGNTSAEAKMFNTSASQVEAMGVTEVSVVDITIEVCDFNGKSYNVKTITPSTAPNLSINNFIIHAPIDENLMYDEIISILRNAHTDNGTGFLPLSDLAISLLERFKDDFITSSAALTVHHNYKGGLVYCKKIYDVSKNAPRESEVVISFNRISELILCFSELFNNYKKLFYKLLQGDLSTDERHEFDFLAHFLEMKDILISENFLTYKVVWKRRELYLDEIKNFKLNSIIYSERLFNFHPWNCLEFGDEKSAVSELDKINVFWIQEFRDMIINLENGRKFHFCLENEFDINYIPVKKYLDFGPVDDDFSDDDALVVTDYGEKLRNIDAYYDGNKEINRVHVTIFPDEIGLERLHARNRFLE